ncbi:MAG: tetratricopeptide repeat protein [candidate division Zixibacteria bacterium]|nr:tetratricopeptide repeat protein [candidate division Zixibacteria bacterium]
MSTRLRSEAREYLLQTANDIHNNCVRSSVFTDGALLEIFDEEFTPSIGDAELRELVKNTHRERQEEMEHLFTRLGEVYQSEDVDQMDYLGLVFTYRHMYNEAESLFRRALELNPDANEVLYHLGQVLMIKKSYREVAEILGKCVELKPKFADYRNCLGEAFLGLESCQRAMIEFDEAIKLNLYYGDAYYNKALTYILNAVKREDFKLFSEYSQKTAEMLERAVVICPEYQDDNFRQGKTLLENGDLREAFQKLLAAREVKKRLRFRDYSAVYLKFLLASNKIDEKTLTRRIRRLKTDISKNPHYPDLHYELAVAYSLLGRFIHAKAIEEYKEALRLNPRFERARKNLKLAENEIKGFDALARVIIKQ